MATKTDFVTEDSLLVEYVGKASEVIIPDGITAIDEYAFCQCGSIKHVVIPASVTEIGEGAFAYCSSLESIFIPVSTTRINRGAFYQCTALKDVLISDLSAWMQIDFADQWANPTYYARSLKLRGNALGPNIEIPAGAQKIKRFAFSYLTELK